MADIPVRAFARSAKLAAVPLGHGARAALGVGKRLGGAPAEAVAAEVQARTAEQVFRVLGELKGGAMKVGQALSIFEAALPEEVAAPYRATLTRLQEQAPALPSEQVHGVLAENFGRDWRRLFVEFEDAPAAAASIGQVHRAAWHDGRAVAVKVQYPGADQALRADLKTASRLARVISLGIPGMDIKPVLAELADRLSEELDYAAEARSQRQFAAAFRGDPHVAVPDVVASGPTALVTEWLEGTPLSAIIAGGTQDERDRAGIAYQRFLLSGPARAGLLHADPHPGNFRVTPDGRFGVMDFGAVAHLPQGLPPIVGALLRIALSGDADAVLAGLREEGFVRSTSKVDAQAMLDFLEPFVEPAREEMFQFSRGWLRGQFTRLNDPRNPDFGIGMRLNLPPQYLLIHRVWLGGVGVLCQLNANVPMRRELEEWVPGFAGDAGAKWGAGRGTRAEGPGSAQGARTGKGTIGAGTGGGAEGVASAGGASVDGANVSLRAGSRAEPEVGVVDVDVDVGAGGVDGGAGGVDVGVTPGSGAGAEVGPGSESATVRIPPAGRKRRTGQPRSGS